MLLTVAVIVVVIIAAVLLIATTRPDAFRVERSTAIKAPPATIFALIDDFHCWGTWSPWEKLDPGMKRTFSGAASGVGAVYGWEGKKAGTGRMEITDVVPASKIMIKLDFTKPMQAHNITEFTVAPQGDTTTLTWSMHGRTPFMGKVMHMVFPMDKIVGKDFESGLAALKAAAEA